MLLEAEEAYFWGLRRAVAALCRTILEETADQILSGPSVKYPPETSERMVLKSLPDSILSSKGKAYADEIWEQGNRALHDSSFDGDVWTGLVRTLKIVEFIANRGAFGI
jgi:hypothetical protein